MWNRSPSIFWGIVLVVLGVLFLLSNLDINLNWNIIWPVVLIALGVWLLVARVGPGGASADVDSAEARDGLTKAKLEVAVGSGRIEVRSADIGDQLFPPTEWDPQGREYWRAFGLVLAWPLFVWNVFTSQPMWLWLGICLAQTFALIPLMIYFWGKGAYCGWICSCGALAETLGDAHREKMPHGPFWNRMNLVGQAILAAAMILLVTRVAGWYWPDSWFARLHAGLLNGWTLGTERLHVQLNYYWWVDVTLAGIVGVGCYFWLSGRVWCRFACPLAALMHVYTRFSRFRILSEKKKCISCNVCTSVCHQGIDVMNFANKGVPMADPECVRCSACVQSCPTGTLGFGQVEPRTLLVIRRDRLAASPVLMAEAKRS